jgi:H(+)-transporting ATP synthase subunit D
MIAGRTTATRQALLSAQRRRDRVVHGMALLRRKREALVSELFRAARPAVDARAAIEKQNRVASEALLPALARLGEPGLEVAGWPTRDLSVEIRSVSVWGVPVAEIISRSPVLRSPDARALTPAGVGPDAYVAAEEFERLVETLLESAPREALLRKLGDAVARTSRQVNVLERRLAPELKTAVAAIRRTLDEREREERIRLASVKKPSS